MKNKRKQRESAKRRDKENEKRGMKKKMRSIMRKIEEEMFKWNRRRREENIERMSSQKKKKLNEETEENEKWRGCSVKMNLGRIKRGREIKIGAYKWEEKKRLGFNGVMKRKMRIWKGKKKGEENVQNAKS